MEKHQIGVELTVKGRISTVRWLENAPYNAKKMRNGQYWCYVIEMADEDAAYQLALKLEGDELAAAYRDDSLHVDTGVWVEQSPIWDEEAIKAEQAAQRRAEEAEPIAPGFQGFAEYLRSQGQRVTNTRCHEFAIEQLRTLERKMYRRRADVKSIRQILHDVEWAATTEQAAAIYAQHREQLRAWAAQYK